MQKEDCLNSVDHPGDEDENLQPRLIRFRMYLGAA